MQSSREREIDWKGASGKEMDENRRGKWRRAKEELRRGAFYDSKTGEGVKHKRLGRSSPLTKGRRRRKEGKKKNRRQHGTGPEAPER